MSASEDQNRNELTGMLSLLVVYVVWGSTYLAIRYAVREGSGFPAFWMAASRVLLGGVILFGLAAMFKQSLRLKKSEWVVTIVTAILLWNGGNGLVTWAEQRAHSGYAALVIGTTPFWGVICEAFFRRKLPSALSITSLMIGFAGLAVLTYPMIKAGERADWISTVALLCAPICWSIGSAYQQRRKISQPILVSSAYQQVIGGVVFVLLALVTREPWPAPMPEAWIAWGYLVIFGSVLAFTAYVTALRNLPLPIVMTYAYVNPVIAVLLGWWLLDEQITSYTMIGAVLILGGVGALFHERFYSRRKAAS
ncbi:MAG TPA: EamA family transporter [Kiritimatiellia bacterium]|nr:EamA family transporter [Kiritimatiellia bacterium]